MESLKQKDSNKQAGEELSYELPIDSFETFERYLENTNEYNKFDDPDGDQHTSPRYGKGTPEGYPEDVEKSLISTSPGYPRYKVHISQGYLQIPDGYPLYIPWIALCCLGNI
ncbi:hypothetical protein JTB14_019924 [Gonioctena quinquepunctata]|nr:hypothetical protein JTB14_019924 [Gonioctena quinquepunctata]